MLEIVEERMDYGEARIQVIGRAGADVLFVVYTWRGGSRRIISARQANRRERNAYREILG